MVELEAYAADCRVYGSLEVGAGRLTDALNAAPEIVIRNVRLESLSDGHVVEMPELTAGRAELYAIGGAGPRGEPARRIRTHVTRVRVELGPYHVEGALHGYPAGDPLGMVLRRPSWVPLTDATIQYAAGGDQVKDEFGTLLVNRDLATSMRALDGEAGVMRWESVNPVGATRHPVEPVERRDAGAGVGPDAAPNASPKPALEGDQAVEPVVRSRPIA